MEEEWKEGVRWVKDGWERGDMRGEELERQKGEGETGKRAQGK